MEDRLTEALRWLKPKLQNKYVRFIDCIESLYETVSFYDYNGYEDFKEDEEGGLETMLNEMFEPYMKASERQKEEA